MTATRSAARRPGHAGRGRRCRIRRGAPPVLVRQIRNGIVESVHRGDIVEVDAAGRIVRLLGDPDRVVTLRSTASSRSGCVALIEAGGIDAFDLEPAEIAIMASSHSGEDLHVRTIQGDVSAGRRQPDGPRLRVRGHAPRRADRRPPGPRRREAGPVRHMCSGQHSVLLLLSPAARLGSRTTGRTITRPGRLSGRRRPGVRNGAGQARDGDRRLRGGDLRVPAARGRSGLRVAGRPDGDPGRRPAQRVAAALTIVRDAMLANPEMVGGTPRPARHVADEGRARAGSSARAGWRRCAASRSCPVRGRATATPTAATGMAIKIEDGDGYDRGTWAAAVEALRQAGVLDGQAAPRRSPATTGPACSTRTGGSVPRRSRSSSSRRSASSSADGRPRRRRTGVDRMTAIDPYRTLGLTPGASQTRSSAPTASWPSSTTPTPPARRLCAVPGDPGRLRGADRRAGPWPRLSSAECGDPPGAAAGRAVASRCVPRSGDTRGEPGPGAPARARERWTGRSRLRPATWRAIDGQPGLHVRPCPTDGWGRCGRRAGSDRSRWGRSGPWIDEHGSESDRRNGWSTIAPKSRPRRRSARRATTGPTRNRSIRPGRGRPGTGRQRHVLDPQSEGIRRSAEARPGIPRPLAAGRRRRGRSRWSGRGIPGRTRPGRDAR